MKTFSRVQLFVNNLDNNMFCQQYLNFCRKHVYQSIELICFNTIFQTYRFLPTFITVLKSVPNINDYYLLHDNNYKSKVRVNCYVINTQSFIVTELETYVYISFCFYNNTFLPVHISKMDFESAIWYRSYKIFKTNFLPPLPYY